MSSTMHLIHRPFARRLASIVLAAAGALVLSASLWTAGAGAISVTVRTNAYGTVYEHLKYGPRQRQFLDAYVSATPGAPVVMLVHGGGWRALYGPLLFESESVSLQQQGITVFAIQYDVDSSTMPAFPLEPNDVELAAHWAIANARSYNGNPADLTLLGGSAGGQLVAAAAERLDAAQPGAVRGVVSLSGPTDLTALTAMTEAGLLTNENFITSVRQAVARNTETGVPYLYTEPWQQEAYENAWSPALTPGPNCPRWLLFNSESELIPLSQANELQEGLTQAGCESTLHVFAGTRHAFAYWKAALPQIISFVRSL
jgi:acetyl esterase/lipase